MFIRICKKDLYGTNCTPDCNTAEAISIYVLKGGGVSTCWKYLEFCINKTSDVHGYTVLPACHTEARVLFSFLGRYAVILCVHTAILCT